MSSLPRAPVILLVEDSDDDAFFFQRTVKKAGVSHTVVWVQDGQAAVEYLAQNRPAIVFLDLKLPKLTGFDVLQRLAELKPDIPPVIVLSGSDHSGDIDRAVKLGARGYLVKPVNLPQLQMLLGEYSPVHSAEAAR